MKIIPPQRPSSVAKRFQAAFDSRTADGERRAEPVETRHVIGRYTGAVTMCATQDVSRVPKWLPIGHEVH